MLNITLKKYSGENGILFWNGEQLTYYTDNKGNNWIDYQYINDFRSTKEDPRYLLFINYINKKYESIEELKRDLIKNIQAPTIQEYYKNDNVKIKMVMNELDIMDIVESIRI